MLVKYINEHEVLRAKNPIFVDGVAYSNPSEQTLHSLGYLSLIKAKTLPEKEGYYQIPHYVVENDMVIETMEYEVMSDESI